MFVAPLQEIYVEYDGTFPTGPGRSILFDEFVQYVQGPDCFDLWGENEPLGRPLPLPRGSAASSRGPRRPVGAQPLFS